MKNNSLSNNAINLITLMYYFIQIFEIYITNKIYDFSKNFLEFQKINENF